MPLSICAQEKSSLKDCITYGLKNNRSHTVYENQKKIAEAEAKEALSAYLPSISVTGSLDNNLKLQESVIPAGLFGPDPLKVSFTQKFNATGTAQLDQTIYDQSLLTGLKANKYNKQQAELNQQQNDETIIYNISTAYYQIFVYREQLSILKTNLETYRRQMDISRLQVKKGTALEMDLDRVTVNYNNTVSQITAAEGNLKFSENQLKNAMGFPLSDPLVIDSLENDLPALQNSDIFQLNNRTDYRLSAVNEKLLEIDQKRISAGILPKLTAYARYGSVGFGNTLGPAFSDSSPFSAVGMKLSIPIFDFFKRNAQYNQAKYKHLNALENLKLDEDKYRME
ncbi:MAG TPA: TolC family protein, partial [Pedobacter sp.]